MKNNHSSSGQSARDCDTLRILAIGDCNTCGIGGHNVPDFLTQLLRDHRNQEMSTNNLGAAMYTTREGVEIAQQIGEDAELLLLSFGLVDAWITSVPNLYVGYFPDNPVKRQGRKLLKSLKKKLRGKALRKVIPVGPVVEEEEFVNNLTRIIDTLRAHNPDLRILLWGSAPTLDDERNVILEQYDEILRQTAARYNGRYLDTKQVVAPHPRDQMFNDPVHLSEKACLLVAKAMLPLTEELLKK